MQQIISALPDNVIYYFGADSYDTPDIPSYQSLADIPHLGTIEHGDWNFAKSVIALPANTKLIPRVVEQRVGGVRYHIDQLLNTQSVIFQLGGVFRPGVLVASHISTLHSDSVTNSLFNTLAKPVKKQKRIGVFYVCESSYSLLHQGWRLVTSANSPTEYDLTE